MNGTNKKKRFMRPRMYFEDWKEIEDYRLANKLEKWADAYQYFTCNETTVKK